VAPQPATAATGATSAVAAGLIAGPPIASVANNDAQAVRALGAFRSSCAVLLRRSDVSGLTRNEDWRPACDAARATDDRDAARFFASQFEAVQVGDGKALTTGYYEPEIAGSRDRRRGYETPIYARPDDLIEVDLGQFSTDLKGKKIRGKVSGRNFVPYDDRAQIDAAGLTGRARILAWAADPIELFFLQIQGSGRLRLPDGGIMRVGYDSQNGRDYTGIGKLMLDRGLLQPGQASMQGIMDWLRAHPDEGRRIMEENRSYVFFRELDGPPLGALGLPVLARASVAADPRFVPLGAPVLMSLDRAEPNGIWIAHDTGGAIKGPNRIDTFWGAGAEARALAGGMKARGTAWVLVPRGTLARLTAEGRIGAAAPQP
jgi:membrane-bound lytic murein transglycosylase A